MSSGQVLAVTLGSRPCPEGHIYTLVPEAGQLYKLDSPSELYESSKFTQSSNDSSKRTPYLELILCPALELSCKRAFCI